MSGVAVARLGDRVVAGLTTQPSSLSARQVLWGLLNGQAVARCIYVLADFGVADVLDDEPRSVDELAARSGMNADALDRMLRLVAAHGVFARLPDGYIHTTTSSLLRSDHPQSLRSYTRMNGTTIWRALTDLAHPARKGRPAMDYAAMVAHFAEHPDEGRLFNEAMADRAAAVIPTVIDAYDFGQFETIADIGGGRGQLITAILDRAPTAKGILFDLPQVVADAAPAASPRLQLVVGDFFADPLPNADAYVLMDILHDWGDEEARTILEAVRRAALPGARLLVVEALIADEPGPDAGKVLDVTMLASTDGRERSRDQYTRLLAAGGFRLERVVPTQSAFFVVEATAV